MLQTAPASLVVENVRTRGELEKLLPPWRELVAAGASGTVLENDPDHVAAALATTAAYEPLLVVARQAERLVGVAPCYVHQARFQLELSVWKLRSLAVRLLKTFGDHFVLAADVDQIAVLDALVDGIAAEGAHYDLIQFYNLACDEPLWRRADERFARGGPLRAVLASPRIDTVHQLLLPADHEAYLQALNPSTRKNLRRTTRRLFEEGRAEVFRAQSPDDVPRLLELLDRLAPHTWQGRTYGAVPRATPDRVEYYRRLAEHGWLRAYVLLLAGEPIAYELGCQYDGVYWGQEHGFDQRHAERGPGSIMIHLAIEDLYRERTPRVLDFGLGDAGYKRSFGNRQHAAASLYLVPRGRWRHLLALQRALNGASAGARGLLVRLKLDRLVRRFLKHQG
ncbi:MAG: GNAT family N-acetyltransferase [Pirellulales bacterium]|nr:GNAT family N-acetyltransferase [Pirellulales bacterium]